VRWVPCPRDLLARTGRSLAALTGGADLAVRRSSTLPVTPRVDLEELVARANPRLRPALPASVFGLLDRLLVARPERRARASDALQHEFFATPSDG
jgi:hypothetical protein